MKIFVDGSCKGNPGEMLIGVLLDDVLQVENIGYGTNNIAEYEAVVKALRIARDRGIMDVEIMSDSKLVVNQLSGAWRVNDTVLRQLIMKVNALRPFFGSCVFTWIPRAKNVADVANYRA